MSQKQQSSTQIVFLFSSLLILVKTFFISTSIVLCCYRRKVIIVPTHAHKYTNNLPNRCSCISYVLARQRAPNAPRALLLYYSLFNVHIIYIKRRAHYTPMLCRYASVQKSHPYNVSVAKHTLRRAQSNNDIHNPIE